MILFLLKKTFFDVWDNLFTIFFVNVGCTLIIGAGLYLPSLLSFHPVPFYLGILLSLAAFSLYVGGAALLARDVADYQAPGLKQFGRYLKEAWQAALALLVVIIAQLFILLVIIPWYFKMGHVVGLVIASLLFWVNVIGWLAMQYYFPVQSRLTRHFKKIAQKSLLLFFDNPGFSVFLGGGTLLLLVLSGVTAFLFPGLGVILLWHQVGLKLRLYKYDYLEQHPEAQKQPIPWDALLAEDRDRVGSRTLRGMIFPWKE